MLLRLALGLLGRKSRSQVLSDLHLEMELQFIFEFFIHLSMEEQSSQSGEHHASAYRAILLFVTQRQHGIH